MNLKGVRKRPSRCSFLKAVKEYLVSDSYMYGPLLRSKRRFKVICSSSSYARHSLPGSFSPLRKTKCEISSARLSRRSTELSQTDQLTENSGHSHDIRRGIWSGEAAMGSYKNGKDDMPSLSPLKLDDIFNSERLPKAKNKSSRIMPNIHQENTVEQTQLCQSGHGPLDK
eukprot:TRINITY_DN7881_c0_g1_i1.p1 TRINITY_DN7881_c0_g1~~TRINITY_DN7881_c0_g1_i1.p1  ORF type:complete len:170 (+),score=20.47 TRINITY_DN7881_c0_g1_i1:258-767(+)